MRQYTCGEAPVHNAAECSRTFYVICGESNNSISLLLIMASSECDVTEDGEAFESFIKDAYAAITGGIKASNSLPCDKNYKYYSCYPTFNEILRKQIGTISKNMQNIIEKTEIAGNIIQRDVEERFDLIQETNDFLLDRAGSLMDEEQGINRNPTFKFTAKKPSSSTNGSWNQSVSTRKQTSEATPLKEAVQLLTTGNIQKPQINFEDKVDNSHKPWEPRIKDKPNSLKPLALQTECGEDGFEYFCHPYEFELDKFEPCENQLQKEEPVMYKPLEETPLIFVDKTEVLETMLCDLKKYKEIAVDLEHHSYRTFQGITCLMQISTYDKDYLIDTLSLRSKLHVLNEVFTNPKILKVFHGADSDICWLQKDLSLYIVNMFDTYQAAKQLQLPFLSLSYLLKKFCKVDPNKHFQMADWRIRPLPEELQKYAREDTHYLLYIKDVLRNNLIDEANGQSNILKVVYHNSTYTCKKVYTKPIWTENSYMSMFRKFRRNLNNRQLYALKEIHKWRDETAREEDESLHYVLPNHMLLNIAEVLPREMQGILACCNPIPPLVRQNLLKIHKMILKARDQPLVTHILEENIQQRSVQSNDFISSESWNVATHDVPSGTEAQENLPCLLSAIETGEKNSNFHKAEEKSIVTVFEDFKMKHKKSLGIFVSPFRRYKLTISMIAEEAKKKVICIQDIKTEKKEEDSSTLQAAQEVPQNSTVKLPLQTKIKEEPEEPQQETPKNEQRFAGNSKEVLTIGQMHGRKRKRQLCTEDEQGHISSKSKLI
ncbi:hypothetical protein TKK_0017466 [Trichogramma kaykai]|uniref:Exosome complex component 10 homolog n=1 Tax=Trichogramma kaykai TaxID=54128 RepID=A0ABD2W3R4_9HYME